MVPSSAMDKILFSGLLKASSSDFSPEGLTGVSEGIENRIFTALRQCMSEGKTDLDSLCMRAGTKRYATSAIRRAVYSIFFDLRRIPPFPPYLHVLAFNETGREILRRMKKTASLPIFHTLPAADSSPFRDSIKKEVFADEIYSLISGDVISGINGFTANSVFFGKNQA